MVRRRISLTGRNPRMAATIPVIIKTAKPDGGGQPQRSNGSIARFFEFRAIRRRPGRTAGAFEELLDFGDASGETISHRPGFFRA